MTFADAVHKHEGCHRLACSGVQAEQESVHIGAQWNGWGKHAVEGSLERRRSRHGGGVLRCVRVDVAQQVVRDHGAPLAWREGGEGRQG